jgi:hypothetical protein
MIYGRSSTPVTGTMMGLAGRLRSTVLGGFENGCDTAKVTSNIESTARIRAKRFLNISISFLVQPVIIFSETRVGLYYAHTVANRPSGLVAKNVTKSVTYS